MSPRVWGVLIYFYHGATSPRYAPVVISHVLLVLDFLRMGPNGRTL